MISNNYIEINNSIGNFKLLGKNSKLFNNDISIIGSKIIGSYINDGSGIVIETLSVEDNEISNIKTTNIEMYAKKAVYNKKNNTIELFKNVKVVRENEIIIPSSNYVFKKNDTVILLSKRDQLPTVENMFRISSI